MEEQNGPQKSLERADSGTLQLEPYRVLLLTLAEIAIDCYQVKNRNTLGLIQCEERDREFVSVKIAYRCESGNDLGTK